MQIISDPPESGSTKLVWILMIRIPNIGQNHNILFIKAKALSDDELSVIMVAIVWEMLIADTPIHREWA